VHPDRVRYAIGADHHPGIVPEEQGVPLGVREIVARRHAAGGTTPGRRGRGHSTLAARALSSSRPKRSRGPALEPAPSGYPSAGRARTYVLWLAEWWHADEGRA